MAIWKAVDSDDLDRKLSDIGSAIRAKTNRPGLIPIQNMASEISEIQQVGGKLSISVPSQTVCELYKGDVRYTKTADSSGVVVFSGLEQGTWSILCTNGSSHGESSIEITTNYQTTIPMNGPIIFETIDRDKYIDITGEWLAQIYYYNGTYSYNHDSWFGQYGKSWVKGRSVVGTTKSVRFYNFGTLKAQGRVESSFLSQYLYMIVSSSTGEVGDNSQIVLDRVRPTYVDQSGPYTTLEFTMDIRSINEGYISFANTYNHGSATEAERFKIEIEKVRLEL